MSAATIQVIDEYERRPDGTYAAPFCTASAGVDSSIGQPSGFDLWIVLASLPAGAELRWAEQHGDEAVFLLAGGIQTPEGRCAPGGAILVETGVSATLQAITDSRIVHFGSAVPEAPATGLFGPPAPGRDLHLRGPSGLGGTAGGPYRSTWYADSSCPTCRITLLRVWGDEPYTSRSHSHSASELIHVTDGALQVGPRRVRAGSTIAIPADARYGFQSTPQWSFLNYRKDASRMTRAPGSEPALEVLANLDQGNR